MRDDLLDGSRFAGTADWFDRFRRDFQTPLDELAEARTKYWANRAMLVTAVSPNGLIDSAGTVYFGFALLADLCRVYNLRAGRTGTAVLLGRVFVNAYLAGNLSDVEKLAEDQYDQLFAHGFEVVGVGVSTNVVGKFLGKVGAKATSGYLNRLLAATAGPVRRPAAAAGGSVGRTLLRADFVGTGRVFEAHVGQASPADVGLEVLVPTLR